MPETTPKRGGWPLPGGVSPGSRGVILAAGEPGELMRFNGGKVRELRLHRGLTHFQVMVGIARSGWDDPPHPQLIRAWETGRHLPGGNYLGVLADFFQVPVGAFFSADDEAGGVPTIIPATAVRPLPAIPQTPRKGRRRTFEGKTEVALLVSSRF